MVGFFEGSQIDSARKAEDAEDGSFPFPNPAGLLLLITLTQTNADIQKIVAFENAFERLFQIIIEEGASDGGIVVQDCMNLVHNLLRYNTSNQVGNPSRKSNVFRHHSLMDFPF